MCNTVCVVYSVCVYSWYMCIIYLKIYKADKQILYTHTQLIYITLHTYTHTYIHIDQRAYGSGHLRRYI